MLMTTRKPATVGEILMEELVRPLGLAQSALAEAMGVPRKHVNQLCNDRRAVTVFGNSPDFWLNVRCHTDLWEALHSPRGLVRILRSTSTAKHSGGASGVPCSSDRVQIQLTRGL